MSHSNFCSAIAGWSSSLNAAPSEAQSEAALSLLDTVACISGGWHEDESEIARSAGDLSATPQALALAIGTAAHVLDFDDYETPASTHPSAPMFGALFAVASRRDATVDELLNAYVVGYECIVRLGEIMGYRHYEAGWHATTTVGTVGAAAACGRLLRLTETQHTHAISLAASMAGGIRAQFGTHTKALHAGLAARAGLDAALLARAGAQGNPDVFESPNGFIDVFCGAQQTATSDVIRRIGAIPAVLEHPVVRKPWPSCAYTHRPIEAALGMRSIASPGDIASVEVSMPTPFARTAGFTAPKSAAQARFSTAWCVASALIDGAITQDHFKPDALNRTDINKMLGRVTVRGYDPGADIADLSPSHPDTVTVTLTNGETHTNKVANIRGGPASPMSQTDILNKLGDCGGSQTFGETLLASSPLNTLHISMAKSGFKIQLGDTRIG